MSDEPKISWEKFKQITYEQDERNQKIRNKVVVIKHQQNRKVDKEL